MAKAPYVSTAVNNPDRKDGGKWYKYRPPGKTLVFGEMPEMPWHKCVCGHRADEHTEGGCDKCKCDEFKRGQ